MPRTLDPGFDRVHTRDVLVDRVLGLHPPVVEGGADIRGVNEHVQAQRSAENVDRLLDPAGTRRAAIPG